MVKKNNNFLFMSAAILLSMAAIIHLLRIFYSLPLRLGSFDIPIWLSVVLVIIAGYLAVSFWKIIN